MNVRVMVIACAFVMACSEGEGGGRLDAVLSLSGDLSSGETLYLGNCEQCHAKDGAGRTGSDIRGSDVTELANAMLNGGQGMSSFAELLTDQEMADISAYVETF